MAEATVPPAAEQHFQAILRGDRSHARLVTLGHLLLATGSAISHGGTTFEAWQFIAAALPSSPRPFIDVAPLLGHYFGALRYRAAATVARAAVACDPGDEEALRALALAALQLADWPTAEKALDRAAHLVGPGAALVMRRLLLRYGEESVAGIGETRARLSAGLDELMACPGLKVDLVDYFAGYSSNLMLLAYHGVDDRPILERIARLYARIVPDFLWTSPHLPDPPAGRRRIRIGIAGSWNITSNIHYFRPLAERLDPGRFDVHVLTLLAPAAPFAPGTQVHALPGHVGEARRLIAALQFDILIYTDVHIDFFFYILAAARLAPVQALLPGHPETSGLPSLDYFIASAEAEPADGEAHYTERLVRLPGQVTPYPRLDVAAEARLPAGVPSGARLYICAQTTYKLHPAFDDILAAILERDDEGCLILFEMMPVEHGRTVIERIRRRLGALAARLVVMPRLPLPEYLALIRHGAVMLDSLHFSGGNTSFQALQLGLPVVTAEGRFMRERMTVGMYRAIGFTDLVAATPEAYVALAVRVATDPDFRTRCIEAIEAGLPTLLDQQAPLAAYEALFRGWAGVV